MEWSLDPLSPTGPHRHCLLLLFLLFKFSSSSLTLVMVKMFQSNIVHCFLLHHHYQLSSYFFSTPMLWVLFPLSSISSSPSLLFCDHCHDYCFLVRLCTIFIIIIMSSPLLSSHSSLSRSSSSFLPFYFPSSSPAQLPTERLEVQVPVRQGGNLVWDLCYTCTISQLSYEEYTDCILWVGRRDGEGEDWTPISHMLILLGGLISVILHLFWVFPWWPLSSLSFFFVLLDEKIVTSVILHILTISFILSFRLFI